MRLGVHILQTNFDYQDSPPTKLVFVFIALIFCRCNGRIVEGFDDRQLAWRAVEYGSGHVWQAYRPLGLAKEARFALLKIFGGLSREQYGYGATMAQVNVLELETRVLLDENLHTSIEEFQNRVQAQWVEVIMDSLLSVSFLIPFSFSSQGNVESFMGSWFLDWMFTTNK